jgi:hypothetical protein
MGGYQVAVQSAQYCRILRKKGVTVRKTIDVLIGTYYIMEGLPLLHDDRDFDPMVSHLSLEVVSKPQIRVKGPAKQDYISDLSTLKYASMRQADPPSPSGLWRDKSGKRSPPEADEHCPEVCAAP